MSKFKVIGKSMGHGFDIGEIVTLHVDDETDEKSYIGKSGQYYVKDTSLEPYTPSRFELGKTYKTREHEEYTCIYIADNGKAWLVSGDSPAYVWDADGRSISLTPAWDVVFGPVVEWVSTCGSWAKKATKHPEANYKYALEFPMVNGVPDFTQAKVTPCT